jgi:hypothetical protein
MSAKHGEPASEPTLVKRDTVMVFDHRPSPKDPADEAGNPAHPGA